MLFMLAMLVPLMILMFWLPRSQQKKQEAAVSSLKRGDRVVTQSGLVGKLVEVGDRYVKVELAPGVNVQMLRTGLVGRDADPAAAAQKADKPAASEKKS